MNPNTVIHYRRNIFKDLFKNAQTKTYTTLGVTVILVVFLAVVAIRPTIIKIGEIQNDIKTKTALKADLDEKLRILNDLDQKYRDYEQIIPLLDRFIPAKSDTASLTANISELAKSYSLTLSSIQFDTSSTTGTGTQDLAGIVLKDGVGLVKISLSLDGTYDGFQSFVKALEQYPRPMHIARFTLSTPEASAGTNKTTTTASNNTTINMDVYTIQKVAATSTVATL